MADPTLSFFWVLAFAPFALLLTVGRKLPSRVPVAAVAAAVAGLAAGASAMGILFTLFGFFMLPTAPNPNTIILLIVVGMLLSIHWAMIKAESSVATYVIGRGATFGSRHRELYAMGGAVLGHLVWWLLAVRYMSQTGVIMRDEFSRFFLFMVIPSAILGAPLAALGALFAPTQR